AKRLVGETIQIVQEETWSPSGDSGSYDAALSLDVIGQPASMRGTLRIEADATGAVEVVRGDIKVSMPFVGRKFEAELSKGLLAAARREEEVGRERLSSPNPPTATSGPG